MNKKVVFVGISGGVDSAVSAALLQKQGYDVVGVFIRTWHPDFLECNEEEERRDAMRVAAHLDIPFLTFDLEDVYKREVADYMIREYKMGRTPNPDVMCNKEVKFGVFLKKALSMGADFIATGHYAEKRNLKNLRSRGFPVLTASEGEGGRNFTSFSLIKGKDSSKDQSYFLWTLNQKQLSKVLFPIGNLKKTQVRKLAKKFNLPVAEKKDSQGICFLGKVDLKEFLKHYIKEKKGKVCNVEGEVIGYHNGVVFHTLGERHGFTITKKGSSDSRYYIVGKDVKKNILVVSPRESKNSKNFPIFALGDKRTGDPRLLKFFNFYIHSTNWISKIPEVNKNYTAQIRYHGEFLACKVICAKSNFAQVIFNKPIMVASGQSCVIYDKDTCLGGGVIV